MARASATGTGRCMLVAALMRWPVIKVDEGSVWVIESMGYIQVVHLGIVSVSLCQHFAVVLYSHTNRPEAVCLDTRRPS